MGSTLFRDPQALSSALAVLGMLQPRAFGSLNRVDPLDSVSNYYIVLCMSCPIQLESCNQNLITLFFDIDTGDYFGDSGTLTFDAENTTQDVELFLRNDQFFEPTETFFVDLTQLDGTLCDTAIVFIQDDDQPPTIPRMLTIRYVHKNYFHSSACFCYTITFIFI